MSEEALEEVAEVAEPAEETQEVSEETSEEVKVEPEGEKSEEAASVSGEEEESEPSGPKKVDASTRVQQAVNEKNEVKAELEETQKKLQDLSEKFEKTQAEAPDFIDVDYDKINQHLAGIESKIEDARLEGNIYEANLLEDEKRDVIADIKANEAKKKSWEDNQQNKANRTQTIDQRIKELDMAAEFYRGEINVPKETWDKMGKLFADELNKNKVLGKKFADIVDRQGSVAAVEWAYTHTKDNLVAKDQVQPKEDAKNKLAAIKTATDTTTGPKNWEALMKMHSNDIKTFHANNPKEYKKLHDKHLATH